MRKISMQKKARRAKEGIIKGWKNHVKVSSVYKLFETDTTSKNGVQLIIIVVKGNY
jgi:hypothetical protein